MKDNIIQAPFHGNTVPLAELCREITDCSHSTPKWTKSGKIVIRNFNIKNGRLLLDNLSYTDEETFIERTQRSKPEPGDLIITREAPMGEVCIIPEGIECCLGQRMVLIKPDKVKVDPKYLLYALQSTFVQKQIQKSDKTGSIVSNLRIPVLKDLQVPVFDSTTNHMIGSFLDNLISKIELNNKINQELEGIAKLLYEYWFVQFNFPISEEQAQTLGIPDLKGKPYKSIGGLMVYNKQLKREIPAGWEVDNILKISVLQGGGTPRTGDKNFWGGDIPFFTPTDAEKEAFILNTAVNITDFGLKNSSTRLFPKGTIFITARGSVGNIMIAGRQMAMNQSCYAFTACSEIGYPFLYFGVNALVKYLKAKSSGSVFKSIVANDIKQTLMVIPPVSLIHSYSLIVKPLFERILINLKQNKQLDKLREWLLPMLMNGQIEVGGYGLKHNLNLASEQEPICKA